MQNPSKRNRSIYYAVLKDHTILEGRTKRKLVQTLSTIKPKDILFICRGVRLEAVKTEPTINLLATSQHIGA
jgi:hypothetical protein